MPGEMRRRSSGLLRAAGEGLTLSLLIAVYAAWLVLIFSGWPAWITCPLLSLLVVQFLSLQHEALHGHPTRSAWLNEALVSLPLGLVFPYRRYRSLHLRHHNDENLTDPFDDPESWYFEPGDFAGQPRLIRWLWHFNALLIGRMILGPLLSAMGLIRRDAAAILKRDGTIATDWLLHLLGLVVLFGLLGLAGFNPLLYALGVAYPALSVLMIRSFAEHRASAAKEHRTAIIPDRGLFALLFLNNNLHAVHHAHPSVPWYRLPRLFQERRAAFEASNGGYGYRSYLDLFRRHWRRPLDSIAHPLWNRQNRSRPLD